MHIEESSIVEYFFKPLKATAILKETVSNAIFITYF